MEELIFARCAHFAASRVTVLRHHVRLQPRKCEAHHMRIAAPALLLRAAGGGLSRIAAMSMRRVMYWWFRFVLSGRFMDRFLCLPR
jgi:ferric-dicitrate binding protein FerR (iron transport regulator)